MEVTQNFDGPALPRKLLLSGIWLTFREVSVFFQALWSTAEFGNFLSGLD
jgi:hypothetical protein